MKGSAAVVAATADAYISIPGSQNQLYSGGSLTDETGNTETTAGTVQGTIIMLRYREKYKEMFPFQRLACHLRLL